MITVVGGVYAERCIDPFWDDVYGSGGRAAAALAAQDREVVLHTYRAEDLQDGIENLERVYGFTVTGPSVSGSIGFDYVHSLSVPKIRREGGASQPQPPIAVEAGVALCFGMLEGGSRVTAERAVYDPQSAYHPQRFASNGSSAGELAICCNHFEARRLTGVADPEAGSAALAELEGAAVVLVKMGTRGVLVRAGEDLTLVPAYRAPLVWKLGSGDVFSAAFTLFWGVEGRAPREAADLASRAVRTYCNTRALPMPSVEELLSLELEPVRQSAGRVYLASPMFDLGQRLVVEEARDHLLAMGLGVFSPLHDVGPGPGHVVAPADLKGIDECDALLAILNGSDPGTIFEVGYAVAKGIPVVALAQNVKAEDLKMVEGSGCTVVHDFVSALYNVAWAIR
jgi:nucleoside 2-deoxyribosyltransferase